MIQKAYSLISVKEVSDEQRVIRGLATSPRPDRVGDIVEPMGVKVADDIPLFLFHDKRLIVGRAKLGKPTKAGIPFEASIPDIAEEGALKSRLDEAWQMVKYRLITAVSIGFTAVASKVEGLKGGGTRFLETEVLELSLVPVPAQADAVISQFKSMPDDEFVRLFTDPASVGEGDRPASARAERRGPVRLQGHVHRKPQFIRIT